MSEALSSDFAQWDQLDGLRKSQAVASIFKSTLAQVLGLDPDTLATQDTWLIGTVLAMSLTKEDFQKLRANIMDYNLTCGAIHAYWFEENDDVLYLHMSTTTDFWQCTRRDRNKGSAINSMANGLPADSPHLLQTVKITSVGHATATPPYEGIRISSDYPRFQLLVHFLRMSARLNPHDIALFIGLLAIEGEGTSKWAKIVKQGSTPECRSMLSAACNAVKHTHRLGGHRRRLAKILTPEGLALLDLEHQLSFAERSAESMWGVVVHISGRATANRLRKMQPSFFVTWSKDLGFGSQIHLIDTPVYKYPYCMLVTCSREPTEADIDDMRAELGEKLESSSPEKDWATEPFEKSDDAWFRADGVLEMRFKDKVIYREVKALLGAGRAGEAMDVTLLFEDPDSDHLTPLGPGDREPWTWVLEARQSDEDGSKQRTTIGKQLTTMLMSKLLLQRRPGDRIFLCVEVCSSNKHPWKDRSLLHTIPRDRPVRLMTTNPDRGTRRSEEVDTLVAWAGAGWYTQGLRMGKGTSNEDWRLVEGDTAEFLKQRLRIGRQNARQGGYHKRSDMAATRFNDAISRLEEVPQQATALRNVIKHAFESHGLLKIMLIARSCPRDSGATELCLNTSIIGQFQSMRNVIPNELKKYCVEWKAEGLSAYTNEFNHKLKAQLAVHGPKVLLLTVRLDHMTKAAEPYDELREMCSAGGHAAMSLFWDHETCLEVPEALRLNDAQSKHPSVAAWADALALQKRAPMVHVNWPMVQPILWIFGDEESTTAHRHVRSAEELSQSMHLSSYQGGDYTDPGFSERGRNGQGFNAETQQDWDGHGKGIFKNELIGVQVIFTDRGGAFECSCKGDPKAETTPPHDDECQCRCSYCEKQRACSCDRKQCVCPPLCNCHCKHCHQDPYNAEKNKKSADSEDESNPKPKPKPKPIRICKTEGCGDKINVKSLGVVYCTTCILRRKTTIPKCRIPECDRDTTPRSIYGSVCETCSLDPQLADNDPRLKRKCIVKGCNNYAPKPGKYGLCCSSACQRSRAGTPKKKRKRELADVGRDQENGGGGSGSGV